MKFRSFISIHALLLLLFGIGFLVIPEQLLAIYGTATDAPGILTARVFGIGNIQLSIIMWYAIKQPESQLTKVLVILLLIGNTLAFLLALKAQVSGMFNTLGWSNVGLYFIFAVGYAYYQFLAKRWH